MPETGNVLHRRDQNRPLDEHDFETVRMFANCGLHWVGFQTWFGRPLKEIKWYIYEAWPDFFAKIEVNDQQEMKKRSGQRIHS